MQIIDIITQERKETTYQKLSEWTGISVSTLRSYKSKGLLVSAIGCLIIDDDIKSSKLKKLLSKEFQYKLFKDEMWLKCPLLDDSYEVSDLGRVRRIYKNKQKSIVMVRTNENSRTKFIEVKVIRKDGKTIHMPVKKLVAATHIPSKYAKSMYITQNNKNRFDCSASNLGIYTGKELGKITGGSARSKATVKLNQVTGEPIMIYRSARQAARMNNLCRGQITCCASKTPTGDTEFSIPLVVGGFKWEYIDDINKFRQRYPDVPVAKEKTLYK